MSYLSGGDGNGFSNGLKGALIGAVSGAVVGGAIGGFTTPKSHNVCTGNRIRSAIESVSELKSIGKLNPYDKGKEGLKLS